MHCHCGTNNRALQWTFMDPCKPEVRPGAREESASPAWLAALTQNTDLGNFYRVLHVPISRMIMNGYFIFSVQKICTSGLTNEQIKQDIDEIT